MYRIKIHLTTFGGQLASTTEEYTTDTLVREVSREVIMRNNTEVVEEVVLESESPFLVTVTESGWRASNDGDDVFESRPRYTVTAEKIA